MSAAVSANAAVARLAHRHFKPSRTQRLFNAKTQLAMLGVTITPTIHGEYRVNLKGGTEATAYYTGDIGDAYNTGIAMARLNAVCDHGEHVNGRCIECDTVVLTCDHATHANGECLECGEVTA